MKPKRVLFLQHGETDKPGLLAEVFANRGIGLDVIRPDLGQPVPTHLDGHAGLAVGGGAQGAYETDRYPYLAAEVELIRAAASAEKPVLGLCLGAQLMATALGAGVRPAPAREIGFFPVTLEEIADFDPVWCGLPKTFVTTHWHGDVFDVPPGGMHLARSEMTPNQLFRYGGTLYGLQFHLEMNPEVFAEMVADSREDLRLLGVDPDALAEDGRRHLPPLRDTAATVFTRWSEFL